MSLAEPTPSLAILYSDRVADLAADLKRRLLERREAALEVGDYVVDVLKSY